MCARKVAPPKAKYKIDKISWLLSRFALSLMLASHTMLAMDCHRNISLPKYSVGPQQTSRTYIAQNASG
jgi:hypothetical protein